MNKLFHITIKGKKEKFTDVNILKINRAVTHFPFSWEQSSTFSVVPCEKKKSTR